MKIYLHTIALEPARWTPQRVSQTLPVLLPRIAEAGYHEVEVFEPHLTSETVSEEIRDAFAGNGIAPIILSSYLNLNPTATTDAQVESLADQVAERIQFYGFQKIRLFPGAGMKPDDADGVRALRERLQRVAARIPNTEILLETHDGSVADDPHVLVQLVEEINNPQVGLLFQPTFFTDVDVIREQFRLEKPYIRHLHLQNRKPDVSFETMEAGVVPWGELLSGIGDGVESTLEFVPAGICSVDSFDIEKTLEQVESDTAYVRRLLAAGA
ncbi:hypothetical protein DB345_19950 [Spartobacteria bacterium LR76]|nr:hypothetical protein DB345_19950 [Spartobacteria bacterium LR76]